MTDINLLPKDKHQIDLKEKNLNLKEKQKVDFDFNNPPEYEKEKQPEIKKLSMFKFLRSWLKERKEKREKRNEEKEKERREKREKRKEKKALMVIKSEVKTKDELFHELDLSQKKIEQHQHHDKVEYTSGSEIEDGVDFAVNLIPGYKHPIKISGRTKLIVLPAVVLLTLAVWVGIFFVLNYQVDKEMQNVAFFDEKINSLRDKIKSMDSVKDKMDSFQNSAHVLNKLMDNHIYASRIFSYLEQNVVPGAYFETINVDALNATLQIQCIARDYTDAAKQILVFEQDKQNVLSVETDSLVLGEAKQTTDEQTKDQQINKFVKFNLEIVLSSGFFN